MEDKKEIEDLRLKFAPIQQEHELSPTCWCEPEIEKLVDGTIIYIHRRDDN